MSKIKCIITDDEPHAVELVESYIHQIPFLELVKSCNCVEDLLKTLEAQPADLVFLDIQMPLVSGMSAAKIIDGPKIIFTTAFDQFALESYKVHAVDYLLKPFSFEEFYTSVQKARELIQRDKEPNSLQLNNSHIIIKADYKLWQIPLEDILYFEGVKDYIRIFRKSVKKVLMPLLSFKTLEKRLPANFMRVHRSFVVNLNNIEVIERNQIVFGDTRITVSEKYKENFNAFISNRQLP